MRKAFVLIILTSILPIFLYGCTDEQLEVETGERLEVDVEIRERLFLTQILDISNNFEHYIGRTVRYEGIFEKFGDEFIFAFVFRHGPGCCGDDGIIGFSVAWDDGRADFPENGEWVEVVGTFGVLEMEGFLFRCVFLTSITVLDVRGEEFVWR